MGLSSGDMQYTSLSHELSARLQELADLPVAPTGRDYIARRPSDRVLELVSVVANSLITHPSCRLHALNIAATQDGNVLFSLVRVSPSMRDIDLWIDDGESQAHWVADCFDIDTRSCLQTEGSIPFDRCGELLPWLFSEEPATAHRGCCGG